LAQRGDWLRFGDGTPARCGVLVYHHDPRHVARVDAIINSARVNLTFVETGWRMLDVPIGEVCRHREDASS